MKMSKAVGIGVMVALLMAMATVMVPGVSAALSTYTYLEASDNNPDVGEVVTFTGNLQSYGVGVNNRWLDLYVDGTKYEDFAQTDSYGVGYFAFNWVYGQAGTHNFQVKFKGDATYAASQSGTIPVNWVALLCTPNAYECIGNWRYQCWADGKGKTLIEYCYYGCVGGACRPAPTPTPTPTPSIGTFEIRAMEDVYTPISGATVTVTGIGTKTTGSNGKTGWFSAPFGTYLDVYITASGYEDFHTGTTFQRDMDTMTWTHYLTPEVTPICEANTETRCSGSNLEVCNSQGTGWSSVRTCQYGCTCSPQPCHCEAEPGPTPTPTVSPTPTNGPTPTPTPDPGTCVANYEKRCFGDYLKTCNSAGNGWDESKTVTCTWGCDAEKKECPGFEAVFALAGLLTVAYMVMRERGEERE